MNDIFAHQERASPPSRDNCQGIVSSLCYRQCRCMDMHTRSYTCVFGLDVRWMWCMRSDSSPNCTWDAVMPDMRLGLASWLRPTIIGRKGVARQPLLATPRRSPTQPCSIQPLHVLPSLSSHKEVLRWSVTASEVFSLQQGWDNIGTSR